MATEPKTTESSVPPAGERVRVAREARGLTQEQLAEAAGVSKQTISNLENGHRLPARRTVERVAAALGSDPGDLGLPEPQQPAEGSGPGGEPGAPPGDDSATGLLNGRISAKLKALRRRDKLTQEDVARGIGVSWRNYQRWEKGRVTPRPESVAELAAFFGVSEREIYGYDPGADGDPGDGEVVEELLNTIAQLVPRVDRLTLRVAELEKRAPGDRAA